MGVRDFSRREILFIALFMGLSAGIIQVLLIREILTLCRGNELIIGMIFSSWFMGIYAGARFRPASGTAAPARRVLMCLIALPVVAAVSVYAAHFAQVVFPRQAGGFYSFSTEIAFAVVLALPSGFFVGLFFPSLVSLLSRETGEKSGGTVFYVESLGSFAGGVVFSFILVELANPLAITSILVMLALVFVFFRNDRRLIILAAIPLLLVVFSTAIENAIFTAVWSRTHAGELVLHQRTKHGLVSAEASGGILSVYGDGILMYNLPDRHEARGIFHLAQSLRGERRKVLLLGSGPGSLLHNLLQTDIDSIHYFEPDPELWGILRKHVDSIYPSAGNKKMVVPGRDLLHFLKNSGEQFDMIISIPPQPGNIMLNRFYTQDYYSLCKSHLRAGGIFIGALHGFSNYMSPATRDYVASLYSAFVNEFPANMKTSGETIFLIGAKGAGVLPDGAEALVRGYAGPKPAASRAFEKEVMDNFSADELRMFFEPTQLRYFDSVIVPLAGAVEPNRDLKPGAYWKNILLAAFREQSVLYGMMRNFVLMPFFVIILSGIALWDIHRKFGPSSFTMGLLIFLTGFISISTMIMLILIYQNLEGIVYYRISLINALFMLGLALGGFTFTGKRFLKPPWAFIALAAALMALLGYTVYEVRFLYWVILLVFSFLCGAVFPLLFASNTNSDTYAAASVLDSMDHFGSIAGSLLAIVLFLPLLGIQGTVIFNILLILSAGLIGFLAFR